MKRTIVVGLIALALTATPRPAEAGFKSAMKKVGHVTKVTLGYAALGVAVIVFCSQGACN